MNKFAALMNHIRQSMTDDEIGLAQVLSFIYQEEAQGVTVNPTRLVQLFRFGTGPTVHRKIADLEFRGYLSIDQSGVDMRSKVLRVTKDGVKYLAESEKGVINAIEAFA